LSGGWTETGGGAVADQRDKPLFLARRGYRQRRVIDAARVLPVFGAFLLLVPVLWDIGPDGGTEAPPRLAERGLYVFGVWGLLVAAAALLGGRLRETATPPSGNAETTRGNDRTGTVPVQDDGGA
jgi:hypothetical protein